MNISEQPGTTGGFPAARRLARGLPEAAPEPAPTAAPEPIPFHVPHLSGLELSCLREAIGRRRLSGDGSFTARCQDWIQQKTGTVRSFLTHSCTAALELAALALDIGSGDEVIMPSYTFVSSASAFALRGAVPVFVDVRADTLNIDEKLIEAAITARTRAIVVVHYAGVACAMDEILAIAARHGLAVIEDAAQGVMASYRGRALGSLGDIGAFSFHETKNLQCGEGGAILVNSAGLVERTEILREKGTDRSRFFRGEVDKYTWQETGSSFLPSELTAAFLWAQLQDAARVTDGRRWLWSNYQAQLQPLEAAGLLTRPDIPAECRHNGHLYFLILAPQLDRGHVLERLKAEGVHSTFHYVPLHSAPAGLRHGRVAGSLANTIELSSRLIRLPLWFGMTEAQQSRVIEVLTRVLHSA